MRKYTKISGMKRLKSLFACALAAFSLIIISVAAPFSGLNIKTAYADRIISDPKRLEYFELKKPLAVARDDENVYIAEEKKLVVYHDDTYDAIELDDFSIKQICKVGDKLLVLNGDELWLFNPATSDVTAISGFESGISAISSCGNAIAVSHKVNPNPASSEPAIVVYSVTDIANFIFAKTTEYKTTGSKAPEEIALATDGGVFYPIADPNGSTIVKQISNTATYYSTELTNISSLVYYNGVLYFFTSNNKLCAMTDDQSKTVTVKCDLNSLGCPSARGSFVSNGNMLICDYENNRIIEYSLSSGALTDFEISFTKIDLPGGFGFDYTAELYTVNVKNTDEIYEIDLDKSLENGYFTYVGYHSPAKTRNYLVAAAIGDDYYLIIGDVAALIVKDEATYPLTAIAKTRVSSQKFVTSEASVYTLPALEAFRKFSSQAVQKFVCFGLEKSQTVTVEYTFDLCGRTYALISSGGKFGYIPYSFLCDSLYVPDAKTDFYTAMVWHKTVPLYRNADLTDKIADIPARSQIMIYETNNGVSLVRDRNGNKGYIQSGCIRNASYYKIRAVLLTVIAAFALMVTALFLERSFLYSKKKV